MPAIRVARNVLVDRLHSDLQPSAAIGQHVRDVSLQTVVRARLDCYPNAFRPRFLRVFDGFCDARAGVAGQSIVQVADEVVAVFFWQAHERSSHHDEFDFVARVAQLLQLLDPVPRLQERMVSRSDRAHARRLVARVALCRVFEVAVRAAWTVDANVPRHANMRATMRLAHHSDYSYSTCRPNRLRTQFGQEKMLRFLRNGHAGDPF